MTKSPRLVDDFKDVKRANQMSNYTYYENMIQGQNLSKLDQMTFVNPIEEANMIDSERQYDSQQSNGLNFNQLKNVNCQEILQKTQKDLKNLLYRASKLVSSDN